MEMMKLMVFWFPLLSLAVLSPGMIFVSGAGSGSMRYECLQLSQTIQQTLQSELSDQAYSDNPDNSIVSNCLTPLLSFQ